jgi:hypothetical protein
MVLWGTGGEIPPVYPTHSKCPPIATEWISEKLSGLDIYSSNLISINLTDFMSW